MDTRELQIKQEERYPAQLKRLERLSKLRPLKAYEKRLLSFYRAKLNEQGDCDDG
jgi:hypothetical protein